VSENRCWGFPSKNGVEGAWWPVSEGVDAGEGAPEKLAPWVSGRRETALKGAAAVG